MPWWGWLVVGIGLLGVEMFVIDAQFYLVFLGVSAIVVGVLSALGLAEPVWVQWLVFSVLALVAMLAFRARVYAWVVRRRGEGAVQERITPGDRVRVPVSLQPGHTCRVDYRGTTWTARNDDAATIEAGTEARITRVDDLMLHIVASARES